MYSSVADAVAIAPDATAQMGQVYTMAQIHVIDSVKIDYGKSISSPTEL